MSIDLETVLGVTVAGAGTSGANGFYYKTGVGAGGRPIFKTVLGHNVKNGAADECCLFYDDGENTWWILGPEGEWLYYMESTSFLPPGGKKGWHRGTQGKRPKPTCKVSHIDKRNPQQLPHLHPHAVSQMPHMKPKHRRKKSKILKARQALPHLPGSDGRHRSRSWGESTQNVQPTRRKKATIRRRGSRQGDLDSSARDPPDLMRFQVPRGELPPPSFSNKNIDPRPGEGRPMSAPNRFGRLSFAVANHQPGRSSGSAQSSENSNGNKFRHTRTKSNFAQRRDGLEWWRPDRHGKRPARKPRQLTQIHRVGPQVSPANLRPRPSPSHDLLRPRGSPVSRRPPPSPEMIYTDSPYTTGVPGAPDLSSPGANPSFGASVDPDPPVRRKKRGRRKIVIMFQPKASLGLDFIGDTISSVLPDHQAALCGIQPGWQVHAILGNRLDKTQPLEELQLDIESLLDLGAGGSAPYPVVFKAQRKNSYDPSQQSVPGTPCFKSTNPFSVPSRHQRPKSAPAANGRLSFTFPRPINAAESDLGPGAAGFQLEGSLDNLQIGLQIEGSNDTVPLPFANPEGLGS